MSLKLERFLSDRWLAGDGAQDVNDNHSSFGVHVEYEDIYYSILFLTCIYISGQISQRLLRMPALVGEIVVGILLGPSLANFVPLPEAWVLIGEIGLILLVIEAGIDIDVDTLKLIGSRGFIIAIFGSIFPISLGILIALILGIDTKAAIAAGCAFGPTSLGIALSILRSGGILNTPVGQLIVSVAVIDDMIALVILSQLTALTGDITLSGILVPIISAIGFLCFGGYIAIYILPGLIQRFILCRVKEESHGKVELIVLLGMLIGLMPATNYAKASFLMGGFVAGLTFCSSHSLHLVYVSQFKRVMQWLMRIFFAASIGFQVPVTEFGSFDVIWKGLVFTLALLGKLLAGFLVPIFTQSKRFSDIHLRDCLITGLSMSAEGEFAFVIAVFAVDAGLIDTATYSAVVLAVLLSTIIPPFLLRFVINKYNKKAEELVRRAAEEEINRRHDLESCAELTENEESLIKGIKNHTVVFLCVQTQSESRWGLMYAIMNAAQQLKLEVIDHRSWHPRGVNTTLVNEIYVRDNLVLSEGKAVQKILDDRIAVVSATILDEIDQPGIAKVKVTRWYPGVVTEIVDELEEKEMEKSSKTASLQERLLHEAATALEKKQQLQTGATHQKSLKELMGDFHIPPVADPTVLIGPTLPISETVNDSAPRVIKRRVRQRMRSTPVFGGSLFGEDTTESQTLEATVDSSPTERGGSKAEGCSTFTSDAWKSRFAPSGKSAELTVDGETYQILINQDTLRNIKRGYAGETLDRRGFSTSGTIHIDTAKAPVVNMLQGYVRNTKLTNDLGTMDEASEESNLE